MGKIALALMYSGIVFAAFCLGIIVGAGATYDAQHEQDYTITIEKKNPTRRFEFSQLRCREVN